MKTAVPVESILIAGIGNIFQGDDAFGVEVARRLADHAWPEGVRAVDFGIRGYDLAFALLDGIDLAILVDATSRGGRPGTLYLIEPDAETATDLPDAHSMNPITVLQMVRTFRGDSRDDESGRVLLMGCEPESCEERMGLSGPVKRAVDRAVTMIEDLVRKEKEL